MIVNILCVIFGFVLCVFIRIYREQYLKQKRHWEKCAKRFYGRYGITNAEWVHAVENALLGDDYYIVGPVNGYQGNLETYYDIIEKYVRKHRWWKPIDYTVIDDGRDTKVIQENFPEKS